MGCFPSKSSRRFEHHSENHANSSPKHVSEEIEIEVRICAGCNTHIGHGRRYKSSLNAFWHPKCFCCEKCDQKISNYEFTQCGSYFFHKSCYNHYPKCVVCNDNISEESYASSRVGHPFWRQNVCPFHEHDGTPFCCCCKRMMPRDTAINLEEDRNLCLECLDTAIMDTKQAEPLYIEIQRFYEGLDMKLHRRIPLRLVGKQEMREALDEPDDNVPLGLCKTRRTGKSNPSIEATRILVLFGCPRLWTGTIIAHEVMHAWMAQEGYPILARVVEEGMCDVMANMWLEAELSSLSSNNVMSPYNKRKLGQFLKYQFKSDTMPNVYVDGFRQGQQAVSKYGLQRTLRHILKTQNFPS